MKIAAITMVFNEAVFLPIWLNHYGPQLGYENLFVIDDNSSDGSTSDKRIVNLIRKSKTDLDEYKRAKQISYFHQELLRHYDAVIYTDIDEIIVPDPNLNLSLAKYISQRCVNCINPLGLNVLHNVHREKPLDFAQPLLRQRTYVQFDFAYCKPLIARVPMHWPPGFHWSQYPPSYATDLFLFHLRAMDVDVSKRRIRKLNTVPFSQSALDKGHSFQFRLTEEKYLKLFFSTTEVEFDRARPNFDFFDQISEISAPFFNPTNFRGRIARIPDRFYDAIKLALSAAEQGNSGATPLTIADAQELYSNAVNKVSMDFSNVRRNEPCPCGSRKKFKHCHGSLV